MDKEEPEFVLQKEMGYSLSLKKIGKTLPHYSCHFGSLLMEHSHHQKQRQPNAWKGRGFQENWPEQTRLLEVIEK